MTQQTQNEKKSAAGRGWAYLGVALGAAISVCANVAESYLSPDPPLGSIVAAIFWPVALCIAIEIFARTYSRREWWTFIRWAGLVPVALIAGIASYLHMHYLLLSYGESTLITWIGPLAVDGLMVMATGGLIATSRLARDAVAETLTETPEEKRHVTKDVTEETTIEETREKGEESQELEVRAPSTVVRRTSSRKEVSRLASKAERLTERVEALKVAHAEAGKDWRVEPITHKNIEEYLGIKGDQTKTDLRKALYPPIAHTDMMTMSNAIPMPSMYTPASRIASHADR